MNWEKPSDMDDEKMGPEFNQRLGKKPKLPAAPLYHAEESLFFT